MDYNMIVILGVTPWRERRHMFLQYSMVILQGGWGKLWSLYGVRHMPYWQCLWRAVKDSHLNHF